MKKTAPKKIVSKTEHANLTAKHANDLTQDEVALLKEFNKTIHNDICARMTSAEIIDLHKDIIEEMTDKQWQDLFLAAS